MDESKRPALIPHEAKLFISSRRRAGSFDRREVLLLGIPLITRSGTYDLVWKKMEIHYPFVNQALLEGDIEPLLNLCKLNGWELNSAVAPAPTVVAIGSKVRQAFERYFCKKQAVGRSGATLIEGHADG